MQGLQAICSTLTQMQLSQGPWFFPFCTILTEVQLFKQGEGSFPLLPPRNYIWRGEQMKKSLQINKELSTHTMLFLA